MYDYEVIGAVITSKEGDKFVKATPVLQIKGTNPAFYTPLYSNDGFIYGFEVLRKKYQRIPVEELTADGNTYMVDVKSKAFFREGDYISCTAVFGKAGARIVISKGFTDIDRPPFNRIFDEKKDALLQELLSIDRLTAKEAEEFIKLHTA